MKQTPEPHDVLVGFLLLRRALDRRSDLFFAEHGLTDAQFNILNLLASSGGSLGQFALTERLLVGKSSISIVLARMTKAGLIERQKHAKDQRQVVLSLSPKGHTLWSKVAPIYQQSVAEVFGELPKARRRPFIDDLEVLYTALQVQSGSENVEGARSLRETINHLQYGL
jgi:DNA-binding MarR family transcriptional regulator